MGVIRLGGVKMRVLDIKKAVKYYTEVIGLEKVTEDVYGNVYFKGWDEFDHHSVVLTPSNQAGLEHMSFKVENADDLVYFEQKLQQAGVKVTRLPAESETAMGEALAFQTPAGHNMKLYAEIEKLGIKVGNVNPHPWPDGLQGIGAPRIDHLLIAAEDPQKTTDFFMHLLGFWMSERLVTRDGALIASWLFRTNTVHDVAVLGGPGPGKVHHFAFLLNDWNHVKLAADVLARNEVPIDVGPTRHGISRGETIYFFDPSGNRNEVFAGGYPCYPDTPVITWTEDQIGKAIFYHSRELNERFGTVFT